MENNARQSGVEPSFGCAQHKSYSQKRRKTAHLSSGRPVCKKFKLAHQHWGDWCVSK